MNERGSIRRLGWPVASLALAFIAPMAMAQQYEPDPAESPDESPAEQPQHDPDLAPPEVIIEQKQLGNQHFQIFTLQRPSMAKLLGVESIPDDLDHVTISPEVHDLVDRLGDDSYEERVRVTSQLAALPCSDHELYAVLDREPISTEQRWRILAALRERLSSRPSGAMGIRFSRMMNEPVIEQVIPGMPAEKVLESGDRITHINGQQIVGREDLVTHVQRRAPGSIVKLTIQRLRRDERGLPVVEPGMEPAFDTMDVDLELGSFQELDRISRELGEGPVQPSVVQRERITLAESAAMRFAPRPRPIEIDGGLPEQLRAGSNVSTTYSDIEDYPPLQTLLTQRKYIEQGMLTITPALQRQWESHIQLMQDRIMTGTLSRTEREYLIRVFIRYRDTVNEMLGN